MSNEKTLGDMAEELAYDPESFKYPALHKSRKNRILAALQGVVSECAKIGRDAGGQGGDDIASAIRDRFKL